MIPDVHRDDQTGWPGALSFLAVLATASARPCPLAPLPLELAAPGAAVPDTDIAAIC